MPYNLIPVANKVQWKEALSYCGGFDIYHLPEYQKIAQDNNEGEAWLFWFWNRHKNACLPVLIKDSKIISAYGYPGLITNIMKGEGRQDFQDAFLDFLQKRDIKSLEIRQNPLFPTSWLFDGLADIEDIGHTVAIRLSLSEEEQLKQITKGHRYDIRKAWKKGIQLYQDIDFNDIDSFVSMYCDTMKRNGAKDYYYFSEQYFSDLKEKLGDQVELLFARKGSILISGALFFFCGDIIQYHLSGTPEKYLDSGGSKIIIDEVRKLGSERWYRWLHLGGGLGASKESPLFRFKAGFSKIRLPYQVIR